MLINELSKVTGLSIHTLRYYENIGLIEGKRSGEVKSNNYKDYGDEIVEKVKTIKDVQEIGFTLAEIKKMFSDCDSGMITDAQRIEIFDNKIQEVENKIQCFSAVKSRLVAKKRKIEDGLGC